MGKENCCPICGEPTYLVYGKYPRKDGLCHKHSQMLFNKEIEQCPDCGEWHKIGETCKCKNVKEAIQHTSEPEKAKEKPESELTCIICGKPSNGKHFCLECWNKYHEKSVDIRITNCKDTQILDEYGNKKIKCADGVYVRSRAESMISDWFFNKKIRIIYEPDFFYKENGETKVLHPDFYLPDYNVYIEYCELTNKPYLKKREYTQNIYKENNKNVIIMSDKDIENRDKFFFDELGIN